MNGEIFFVYDCTYWKTIENVHNLVVNSLIVLRDTSVKETYTFEFKIENCCE